MGGPFGPGEGMPRGRGGRGGRHRGRRQSRGDVRSALLVLIAEEPRHGYELMQAIGERSGGAWEPSPGSVYPALQQLQDEGLVRVDVDDQNRGIGTLTPAGEEYVAAHRDELDAVWTAVGHQSSDAQRVVWSKFHGLVQALKQVRAVGTPDQIALAGNVVDEATRKLYAILAQEPDGGA